MQIANTNLGKILVPQDVMSKIYEELGPISILKLGEVNKIWNSQVSYLRNPLLSFKQFPKWVHFKLSSCGSQNAIKSHTLETNQGYNIASTKLNLSLDELIEILNNPDSNPQLFARFMKIYQEYVYSYKLTGFGENNLNCIEVKKLYHQIHNTERFLATSFSDEIFSKPVRYKNPRQHIPSPTQQKTSSIKFDLLFDNVSSYYKDIGLCKIGDENFRSLRLRSIRVDSPDSIGVPIKKAIDNFNQLIQQMNDKDDEKYFNSLPKSLQ